MIQRHQPDAFVLAELPDDIERDQTMIGRLLESRVRQEDFDLTLLGNRALNLAARLALAGPAYVNAFYLASFARDAKTLEVTLPGTEAFARRSTGPLSTTHAGRWLDTLFLNLAVRDDAHLEGMLLHTDTRTLRASGTESAAWKYTLVSTFQAFLKGADSAGDDLEATMRQMPSANTDAAMQAYTLNVSMHITGMLGMVMLHDEGGFNRELEAALVRHQQFYGQDAPVGSGASVRGIFPSTGCACPRWGWRRSRTAGACA
ncbi:Imm49 family immunity protein [Deinococcus maricopensis]|nr:Imm49 family immunity protein [Deinococcus maricopensis]